MRSETGMPTLWDLAEIVLEETEKLCGKGQLAQRISQEVLVYIIRNYVANVKIEE